MLRSSTLSHSFSHIHTHFLTSTLTHTGRQADSLSPEVNLMVCVCTSVYYWHFSECSSALLSDLWGWHQSRVRGHSVQKESYDDGSSWVYPSYRLRVTDSFHLGVIISIEERSPAVDCRPSRHSILSFGVQSRGDEDDDDDVLYVQYNAMQWSLFFFFNLMDQITKLRGYFWRKGTDEIK